MSSRKKSITPFVCCFSFSSRDSQTHQRAKLKKCNDFSENLPCLCSFFPLSLTNLLPWHLFFPLFFNLVFFQSLLHTMSGSPSSIPVFLLPLDKRKSTINLCLGGKQQHIPTLRLAHRARGEAGVKWGLSLIKHSMSPPTHTCIPLCVRRIKMDSELGTVCLLCWAADGEFHISCTVNVDNVKQQQLLGRSPAAMEASRT